MCYLANLFQHAVAISFSSCHFGKADKGLGHVQSEASSSAASE